MEIKEFEALIEKRISETITKIIEKNLKLPISSKSRAGAEISDWIEKAFVEELKINKVNDLISAESAPKGKTKHPWDARVFFSIGGIKEEIWIDFKAIKINHLDSNRDIGTPTKFYSFLESGGFYILYIFVYYEEIENGLQFKKHENVFVKSYFLKDINKSFRRNPKNQLQVNISAEPSYRTRENFIKLLMTKELESYERQLIRANENIKKINNNLLSNKIENINKMQEDKLIKELKKLK